MPYRSSVTCAQCSLGGRAPWRRDAFLAGSSGSRRYRQPACPARSQSQQGAQQQSTLDRRDFMVSLSAGLLMLSAQSKADVLNAYVDERDSFSISVPEGWSLNQASNLGGSGPTATRRTLSWFEDGKPSTSVTVVRSTDKVITNVGADYTSLGSFGTAEQFGSNLVASMDMSFLKRAPKWAKGIQEPQEVKLLGAREANKAYNIEYIVKRDQEDPRHLLSTIALGYNGRYTRLYTVTAQCFEPQLQEEKATLKSILASFKPPNPRV